MLQKALTEYGNRVIIITDTPETGQNRKVLPGTAVDLSKLGDRRTPSATIGGDRDTPEEEPSVDGEVRRVIARLGLYQDVGDDLSDLQKALFEEGWRGFLKDLGLVCPTLLATQNCIGWRERWSAIRIVSDEQDHGADRLVYKRFQSEDRWGEKFSAAAMGILSQPAQDLLKPVADDIARRVFQGYPYGKLSHLKKVTVESSRSSTDLANIVEKPVACFAAEGSYYMDIDQYVADRFPRAFATFLQNQIRQGNLAPTDLYVHDQSIEAAYEFHRRDEFASFYQLQTRRGQLHRNIYLAVRAEPLAYRVVLTDVSGRDRQANVLCQVYSAKVFAKYHAIESDEPKQLFLLNSAGNLLTLTPADWLVIGFKGNWARRLVAEGWQQTALVSTGLDIDLFTHPADDHRIVVARNVYGDDVKLVLDAFYRKGARQVIYLGSAGAISDYQVGDVVIPNHFVDLHQNTVPFHHNLAQNYAATLARLIVVHANEKHVSVATVFDETRNALDEWRANSIGSIDIEAIHLARFAGDRRDVKMALMFVISDQTLGAHTIEQSNAHRRVIDESVDKMLSFLLRNHAAEE